MDVAISLGVYFSVQPCVTSKAGETPTSIFFEIEVPNEICGVSVCHSRCRLLALRLRCAPARAPLPDTCFCAISWLHASKKTGPSQVSASH